MYPVIARALASSPSLLASLAARLGISARVAEVMNFARTNPSTFMLALKEVYDQGSSLYSMFSDIAPADVNALAKEARTSGSTGALIPVDPVDGAMLSAMDALSDEMDTIAAAIRVVGGFDQLQALRRALTMRDEHFALYLRMKRLANRM